jgi:chemosensory pili system protein ChpA (sensor histidine kinase/response regulator)
MIQSNLRNGQRVWSECEITFQRVRGACAFVAFAQGGDGEEVMRSSLFRRRKGGGAPDETPDAVASLAALEQALTGEGWEPIEEPHDAWYARRFRRSVLPLSQRIAPYRADGALIAFVGPEPSHGAAALEPAALQPMPQIYEDEPEWLYEDHLEAERQKTELLESERLEAERLDTERLEAEQLEAERQKAERLEAARLQAERLEAVRLEAERLEAERRKAEQLEAERLEAERREAARLEAERLEAERVEAERLEAARLEAERVEAERLEAERLEAERLAAEQKSPLRDLITSYAASYDRDLNVRSIYGGECPQFIPDRLAAKARRRRR